MTIFDDTLANAQKLIPNLQVKYKDQSTFMKILGVLMFFTPGFMTDYITSIGSTLYYPSEAYIQNDPIDNTVVLLHEIIHIEDEKNDNSILFGFLYLLPQLLTLLFIPLLFIVGWKFALIAFVFALPLPAYFRMQDEKKAYTIALYTMYKLNAKLNIKIDISQWATFYALQFKNSAYYFMWPFSGMLTYFTNVAEQIQAGQKPEYDISVYNLVDQILG
jgi:hypothetical protein